jgi:dihydrofolate synthase/folylpolyglutamate synthase
VDYRDSIDYLYGLQLFGIKLGLENVRTLLSRLGDPHQELCCLHVAGTNGKGSVSLLLSEILQHAGFRVGLYTSPHLHEFTERIRIDGEPISPEMVSRLTDEIRQVVDEIPVTFFEATTAMALQAFCRAKVDFAIIETGLGGRLDATNVISPRVVCITPVGLDHQEYLGSTLSAIAGEKAGIIKPGVPVVAGQQGSEVTEVLQRAAENSGSRFLLAGRDYAWQPFDDGVRFSIAETVLDGLSCGLAGAHQMDNYAQALATALVLRDQGVRIPDEALVLAGKTACWPGRLEMYPRYGVLLDAAHNQLGMESLAKYLSDQGVDKVHLVAGLSRGRSSDEVMTPLLGRITAVEAVPVPDAVSVPPEEIAAWAIRHGVEARCHASPQEGLNAALATRLPGELVVVCGSLFLVSALRSKLLSGEASDLVRPVDVA